MKEGNLRSDPMIGENFSRYHINEVNVIQNASTTAQTNTSTDASRNVVLNVKWNTNDKC